MGKTLVQPQRKMASIQEQLKQIQSANEDWCDEHRQIVNDLAQVSEKTSSETGQRSPNPESGSLGSLGGHDRAGTPQEEIA